MARGIDVCGGLSRPMKSAAFLPNPVSGRLCFAGSVGGDSRPTLLSLLWYVSDTGILQKLVMRTGWIPKTTPDAEADAEADAEPNAEPNARTRIVLR